MRFNTNGSYDTSFDGDGLVTTKPSTPNNDPFGRDEIRGLALLPDGRIVCHLMHRPNGMHHKLDFIHFRLRNRVNP